MSHEATNWAIKQRGLTPAQKIVLWHLCDRYHPDNGCFPSQDVLAYDCEISRSGLNNNLSELERKGLIYRKKRLNKETKRQKSTRYILRFEAEFNQYVDTHVQILDMEAVSKKQQKPCPKNGDTRVQILDTNPVREPVREPVSKKSKPKKDLVFEALVQWASTEAVQSFIAYRKKHKAKALTETAARRLANSLQEIFNAGCDPSDALGLAEERGWASVTLDWYKNSRGRQNGKYHHSKANSGVGRDPVLDAIAIAAAAFEP